MQLSLEPDPLGHLIVRQRKIPLLRYVIGIPLLLWGALMLYGVFSSFIITLQIQGAGGIGQAVAASFLLLVFAAMLLPLGWWLVFSKHWIMLEAGPQDIVEVSDWKLGRKEKRTPASAFKTVRVALEPLDSAPNAGSTSNRRSSRKIVYGQAIRLLAHQPKKQPSLEIGWLEEGDREAAIAMGQQVADFLKLPLEVADSEAISYSPAREEADTEAENE